jgi:endonuclease/exonuclease/phosphatase family metal-dependent hydrolase
MPLITDPPPADVVADLAVLKAALNEKVPKREQDNLLIATWNIRAFGSLTRKWHSGPDDSPRRDLHSALAIAEVLGRFDVIAIQEVKADLRALRDVLKLLGPQWAFAMTDVTYGNAGNAERLAYLFDTERVRLSGLACELVVPDDLDTPFSSAANAFQRQFVRTPYAVSFLAGKETFVLVTLHVIYGDQSAKRKDELTAIARWLRAWAEQEDEFGPNLICLGDFNIDREGDPLYEAFISTGLTPAPGHKGLPRTVFDGTKNTNFFDQVAWFETIRKKPYLSLKYRDGGNFDFRGVTMPELTIQQLSYRISDHFPLWVEFGR